MAKRRFQVTFVGSAEYLTRRIVRNLKGARIDGVPGNYDQLSVSVPERKGADPKDWLKRYSGVTHVRGY